jgi:3alpha(or 20beta)-hydroxysteroid dehydrogenase
MDRLKNKIVLISGGARGMGATEARLFVSEGARVMVADVLDDEAEALAEDLNSKVGCPYLHV